MIDSMKALLMNYFPDSRPVLLRTLERKCNPEVLAEAINGGYLTKSSTSNHSDVLLVITRKGYDYRNN